MQFCIYIYLLYLQNDEACSILEIGLGCTQKCSMEEFGAHFFAEDYQMHFAFSTKPEFEDFYFKRD